MGVNMTLGDKQKQFTRMVVQLLNKAHELGFAAHGYIGIELRKLTAQPLEKE